ncbi:hypothetical protein HDV06_004427 [Boothiomyces sp. JEL0866]|nr:hypothetical protein HDV06_004427 [Boothiomyces sp. JEL0866]
MTIWTPQIETALYQAIILYRPIGIHSNFRLVNIHRYLVANMGTNISISEIKEYLDTLYDLKSLSEKQDEEIPQSDFALPFEEYEELIDKLRKADEASEGTPPKKKTPARKSTRKKKK